MAFWRRSGSAARPAYPPEVVKRVRALEVKARGLVESLLSGEHGSLFHGHGLEFSHVRQYQVGDDVRAIDWRVTARRQEPYVRQFVAERDLTVVLLLDLSASQRFGGGRSHADAAREVAAVLALSASRNNDPVSLVVTTDRVERFVPPRAGRREVLRLVLDLLALRPRGTGTDLAAGLDRVARAFPRRAIVFVISDFVQEGGAARLREGLARVSRRHDLVAVRLSPPDPEALPDVGWAALWDPESGRRVVVDTGNRRLRAAYRESVSRGRAELNGTLGELGADLIEVDAGGDVIAPLARFFRGRGRTDR